MRLAEKRFLFTARKAALVQWAHKQGLRLVEDEGRVFSPRAVWQGGKKVSLEDAVHKKNSFHHAGLAQDFVLYDDAWQPVFNGDDPRWKAIGKKWKSLSQPGLTCVWGGDFPKVDSNHFSLNEGA